MSDFFFKLLITKSKKNFESEFYFSLDMFPSASCEVKSDSTSPPKMTPARKHVCNWLMENGQVRFMLASLRGSWFDSPLPIFPALMSRFRNM